MKVIFESLKTNLKNQEKRIHFIVHYSRHRKDKDLFETKIHPPKQQQKEKAEFKHTNH